MFFINDLLGFLESKHDYLNVTGTNHYVKNLRYQMIVGNYVAHIGNCLIGAGISKKPPLHYLYYPKDFVSDFLILQIHYVYSTGKVLGLENQYHSAQMSFFTTQFCNHLNLFAVN